MKRDRAFVAAGGDGFEACAASRARVFFEGLIQHLAHAPASVVGVDADQVHVARLGWARSHEAEQETDENAVVLDDAGHRTELMEENRMCQSRRRPAPPAIDDLDDVIVVLLTEGPSNHWLHLRCAEIRRLRRYPKGNTHLS